MIAPDTSAALRLMDGLHAPGSLLRLVGADDAIGAKLIEAAGFDGIWASSLEIATCCGHVDDDDSNFTDVLPAARTMASCCRLPVVADCGTGGATSEATAELVRACATEGIAALCLEDARQPKCNSLLPGKHRLAPAARIRPQDLSGPDRRERKGRHHRSRRSLNCRCGFDRSVAPRPGVCSGRGRRHLDSFQAGHSR